MRQDTRGGVAKWTKATVCKTVIHGFESRRRLHLIFVLSLLFASLYTIGIFPFFFVLHTICIIFAGLSSAWLWFIHHSFQPRRSGLRIDIRGKLP